MNMPVSRNISLLLVLTLLPVGTIRAQVENDTKPEVKVARLLDRLVEVCGGKEAWNKLKNRKATMELKISGMDAVVTVIESTPNKSKTVMSLMGMAIEDVCDGKIIWSRHPINGLVVLEGKDLDVKLEAAKFDKFVAWRKNFKAQKYEGIVDVDEKPCHKITMTPHHGHDAIWYLDVESGLQVREDRVEEAQGSRIEAKVLMSDYRSVDGVKIPFTNVMDLGGLGKHTQKIKSIKHNVELPKDIFALPDDVKKILAKRAAAKKKSDSQRP